MAAKLHANERITLVKISQNLVILVQQNAL
jgi:hypothetical protein